MKSGFTITELMITIIIVAIITSISVSTWQAQLEKEYANNAKAILNATWQAEQTYFSWKNTYTNNTSLLEIKDPNSADRFYCYTIAQADAVYLQIFATRKNKSQSFTINESGSITQFSSKSIK